MREAGMRFLVALLAIPLSGCFATFDLATDPSSLSQDHQRIARRLSEGMQKYCVRYRAHYGTLEPPSGYSRFNQPAAVKTMYSSNTTWYKGDVVADSVFGTVYYDDNSGRFFCSDEGWMKWKAEKYVVFTEIPVVRKQR